MDADAKLTLNEFAEGVHPKFDFSKKSVKAVHSVTASRVTSPNNAGSKTKSFIVDPRKTKSPLRSSKTSAKSKRSLSRVKFQDSRR